MPHLENPRLGRNGSSLKSLVAHPKVAVRCFERHGDRSHESQIAMDASQHFELLGNHNIWVNLGYFFSEVFYYGDIHSSVKEMLQGSYDSPRENLESAQGENEDGKQCPSNSMLGSAAVSRCSCLFPRFVSKIWNFMFVYAHEMLGDGHLDVKQC